MPAEPFQLTISMINQHIEMADRDGDAFIVLLLEDIKDSIFLDLEMMRMEGKNSSLN